MWAAYPYHGRHGQLSESQKKFAVADIEKPGNEFCSSDADARLNYLRLVPTITKNCVSYFP